MDTGRIRMWPRMTRDQLVRVFPDQRTVYLPTDNQPLAGYEQALADIQRRGDGSEVRVADTGGLNPFKKLLHLARGESDEEESDTSISAAAAEPPEREPLRSRAKAAMSAAVDKVEQKIASEKATLAAVAVKAHEKLAAEKNRLASLAAKARMVRPADAASTTAPSQIVVSRTPDDGAAGSPPTQSAAGAVNAVTRPNRGAAPASEPTGSVAATPKLAGADDHAAPEVALAYAEQRGQAIALPAAPVGSPDALRIGPPAKRLNGRSGTVVNVVTKKVSPLLADPTRLTDLWLRAIMLSPNVQNFLSITSLGARDFRTLSAMMVKPTNSVMITFAADPNPGLEFARFSGAATVFVPTVGYSLRSAQLH
jgi:hypothetical protein